MTIGPAPKINMLSMSVLFGMVGARLPKVKSAEPLAQ